MTKSKAKAKLPKKFGGAEIVRGKGMSSDDLETFLERNAMDTFDATREMWIVIEDGALEDLEGSVDVKGFGSKDDALVYARARSNGNVDHRVLRVAEQVLVIAMDNNL